MSRVIKCEPFPESEAARFQAQWPVPESGTLFQQADFSGSDITVRVYDLSVSNSTTAVFSNTRAISAVVTNSPGSWDIDSTGYNFSDNVLTSEVVYEGGHTYRFSYEGVRSDSTGSARLAFEARCDPDYFV